MKEKLLRNPPRDILRPTFCKLSVLMYLKLIMMILRINPSLTAQSDGSLMNLAKHPSSTVHILGAEKVLFKRYVTSA